MLAMRSYQAALAWLADSADYMKAGEINAGCYEIR